MGRIDTELASLSGAQQYLVTRAQILEVGGSDGMVRHRLEVGAWLPRQDGVYQTDRRPADWQTSLQAVLLAGGDRVAVSHRAALIVWGLDGLTTAPLEVTAPFGNLPTPHGAIVHRTRRTIDPVVVDGVRSTSVERTLLDAAALLPSWVVAKALESSLRKRLTTIEAVNETLALEGGRGVRGTRLLRRVIADRLHDTPTGSGAETELLLHLRRAQLPEPELQTLLNSLDGDPMRPDFYWPDLGKAIEVDGLDAHDSADKLDSDLRRQNALLDLGVELRRFSARDVRRRPDQVIEEIRRFLRS